MAHILAIRFSALGDVAMAIPVIYSFAKRYPQHEITLLSRSSMTPLFKEKPLNVHFKGIHLDDYKGLIGLHKLANELKEQKFDAIADLHDVLRTKFLRQSLYHTGIPIASIDKGRREKRHLTRTHHKELNKLTASPERYAIVFAELGFPFHIDFTSIFNEAPTLSPDMTTLIGEKGTTKWIGIAPFAAHKGKIYPLSKMEKVIDLLNRKGAGLHVFLFGAGEKELLWCKKWETNYNHVTSLVGQFNMTEELKLMYHLDTILTMDSANMHLASLVNTPIVSIWGATHPYAGFAGLQPQGSHIIQRELDCRPCSIFGNKKCIKGNYDCMWTIEPQEIVDTIMNICHTQKL